MRRTEIKEVDWWGAVGMRNSEIALVVLWMIFWGDSAIIPYQNESARTSKIYSIQKAFSKFIISAEPGQLIHMIIRERETVSRDIGRVHISRRNTLVSRDDDDTLPDSHWEIDLWAIHIRRVACALYCSRCTARIFTRIRENELHSPKELKTVDRFTLSLCDIFHIYTRLKYIQSCSICWIAEVISRDTVRARAH